jgi:outer membrane protein assembly factor BamB
MKRIQKRSQICFLLLILFFMSSCAGSNEVLLPQKWDKSVNWENYSSAETTPTDHLVVQSSDDIVVINGNTGKTVLREVTEEKGLFGQFVEEAKSSVSLKGEVPVKYYHAELPSSGHMLLFDNSEYMGEIRAIDLETGEEKWNNKEYSWTLDLLQDAAGLAVRKMVENFDLGGAAGTAVASSVLLQTRLIDAMVADIPGRNEFLFRTIDKLYMIDAETGEPVWENSEFNSTGIAAVKYMPDSEQLLIAGSTAGLREILQNAASEEGMKQVALVDVESGQAQWVSEFKGRSEQIDRLELNDKIVKLYFYGGSVEVFNFQDGTRLLGTRDDYLMGAAKVGSFLGGANTEEGVSPGSMMETANTAEPVFEGQAVYAVNPTSSSGIINKKITKFDADNGEIIWESKELKNTPDITDLYLLDNTVIATVFFLNPGSIMGRPIDAGLYALNKEDGKLVWSLTKPFAESKNQISNVIFEEDNAWTAGNEAIYQINLQQGTISNELPFADTLDIGSAPEIKMLEPSKLIAVGGSGFIVFDKNDLTSIYSEQTDARSAGHYMNDNHLFYLRSKLLSDKVTMDIYDLAGQSKISEFTLTPIGNVMYGEFCNDGYHLPQKMDQVILSNDSGITSYVVR